MLNTSCSPLTPVRGLPLLKPEPSGQRTGLPPIETLMDPHPNPHGKEEMAIPAIPAEEGEVQIRSLVVPPEIATAMHQEEEAGGIYTLRLARNRQRQGKHPTQQARTARGQFLMSIHNRL